MEEPGNLLLTIAEAADHDREEVAYPTAIDIDPDRGTYVFRAPRGQEYVPLAAGFGRYALVGACKYLETDESGRERCSVYEQRPGVCRKFEVASEKCVTIRTIHGVPLPPGETGVE